MGKKTRRVLGVLLVLVLGVSVGMVIRNLVISSQERGTYTALASRVEEMAEGESSGPADSSQNSGEAVRQEKISCTHFSSIVLGFPAVCGRISHVRLSLRF